MPKWKGSGAEAKFSRVVERIGLVGPKGTKMATLCNALHERIRRVKAQYHCWKTALCAPIFVM